MGKFSCQDICIKLTNTTGNMYDSKNWANYMTAFISTMGVLGRPINEHAEAERRANFIKDRTVR